MFEIIIVGISSILMAYCFGILIVIIAYLKAMGKILSPAIIGGTADILFMFTALWHMLSVPFNANDIIVWIKLGAFILSAISFGIIHKVLERK